MYWGVWGDISDMIAGEGAPGGEFVNHAEKRYGGSFTFSKVSNS